MSGVFAYSYALVKAAAPSKQSFFPLRHVPIVAIDSFLVVMDSCVWFVLEECEEECTLVRRGDDDCMKWRSRRWCGPKKFMHDPVLRLSNVQRRI